MCFTDNVIPHSLAHQLASELADTVKLSYSSIDAKIMSPRDMQNLRALLPLAGDDIHPVTRTSEQTKAMN